MKKIIMTAIVAVLPSLSSAETYQDEKFFQITSVETKMTQMVEKSEPLVLKEEQPGQETVTKIAPVAVGAVINTGAAAWNVVNNGQASSNISHYYANAIPGGLNSWTDVVGWKGPKEVVYTMSCKNLYGITVLDLEYVVSFYYGGNIKGKGRYITNFTVKPRKLDLSWGFKFDMDLQISNPMNVGTAANPMAYLQADVSWTFGSMLKKTRGFETYGIYGDGRFNDIGETSKAATLQIPQIDASTQIPAVQW